MKVITTIPFTQKELCEHDSVAEQSNAKVVLDCCHNGITLTGDYVGKNEVAEREDRREEIKAGSGKDSKSQAQAHEAQREVAHYWRSVSEEEYGQERLAASRRGYQILEWEQAITKLRERGTLTRAGELLHAKARKLHTNI